jgi:hypothetical protein
LTAIGGISSERLMDFLCQAFFISTRIAVNEGFW